MLRTLRIVLSALIICVAVVIVIAWTAKGDFFAIPGAIIGGAATTLLVLPDKERTAQVWTLITYLALAAVNVMMIILGTVSGQLDNMKFVVICQSAWALLGLALLIVAPVRERQLRSESQRAWALLRAQEALDTEQKRIAERRRQELAHAERVERVRLAADRATTPGDTTGYEPQPLAEIVLERPPHMYGEPGAGLSGSGFAERSVKSGQAGEVNFAKALQKDELLERFASFWSVHMPDEVLGASEQFQGDVDCVLVSGSTLWLLDMKNYKQGGVFWRTENRDSQDPRNPTERVLVAIDRETNGYVGPTRTMSNNMRMATERFERRLKDSGLRFEVIPVVVMMPQRDGLGTIEGIFYPGEIPAVGLPTLLESLRAEDPFQPSTEDAQVLTSILKSLLKEESGTAVLIDSATGRRKNEEPHDSAG